MFKGHFFRSSFKPLISSQGIREGRRNIFWGRGCGGKCGLGHYIPHFFIQLIESACMHVHLFQSCPTL